MASYSGSGSLTVDLDIVDGTIIDAKTGFSLDIPMELVPDIEDVCYELKIEFDVIGTRTLGGSWEPDQAEEDYQFSDAYIGDELLDYELGKKLFEELYDRLHEVDVLLD